jgi:hypothetical protein
VLPIVKGTAEDLRIRWFDPLDVTNGFMFQIEAAQTYPVAKSRGVERPYVVHLAWIKEEAEKRNVLAQRKLWFVRDGKCDAHKTVPKPWR